MKGVAPRTSPLQTSLDREESLAFQVIHAILEETESRLERIIEESFEFDDTGNSNLFARMFSGSVLFVRGQGWKVFDNTNRIWISDPKGNLVRRLAMAVGDLRKAKLNLRNSRDVRWAERTANRSGIESMLLLAESNIELLEERDRFDADSDAVLDSLGYRIDLRTGNFEIAMPHHRFTKRLGTSPSNCERGPRWLKFLEEIMPDPEVRDFLQVFAGYILTGHVSEHVLLVCHGAGANGKSVFINTLQEILGDYAKMISPELLLPPDGKIPPHEVAELEGLRLAVFSETEQGGRLSEAALKRITSEDKVHACRKYEAPHDFRPSHKGILASNHMPHVRSFDEGTWRRLVLVRFPVTIPEANRNQHLQDELRREFPDILAWAIEGARRWYSEGLVRPESVKIATSSYRESEDAVGQFIECQKLGSELSTRARPLWEAYQAWGLAEGVATLSQGSFRREMESRGFIYKRLSCGKVCLGIEAKMND